MAKKKFKNPKKARSLFFRDKTIISEKKKLNELKKQREQLIENIREIAETYNNKALDIPRSSAWLERLPLQSLQDLYQFLAGSKNDYVLSTLELRSRLKDEHSKVIKETAKVDQKIYLSKIELLLAKINCVQSELGADK